MGLHAWISEWQKGVIDAKETRMQMEHPKSVDFSKPLCQHRSPLRTKTAQFRGRLTPA